MPKQPALVVVAMLCLAAATYGVIRYSNLVGTITPPAPGNGQGVAKESGEIDIPPEKPLSAEQTAAVLHANNVGVGQIEQLTKAGYLKAIESFEEVTRLAPGWLPGYINLGIALLNTDTEANKARARQVFAAVLRRDPDNPYAHFCLGILMEHKGDQDEIPAAVAHFEAVTRLDPNDAAAWYWLGNLLTKDSERERQQQCFSRAHALNPNMTGPLYGLAMGLRMTDQAEAMKLLGRHKELEEGVWQEPTKIEYDLMGRYGNVIHFAPASTAPAAKTGPIPLFQRDPKFQVQLAAGVRWAKADDFKGSPADALRARVRARFGATLAMLDYDRDGKPDLLLLGAVVESGKIRDLLLHNEGGGRFTDVTAKAGLGGVRPSLGCCVADFDNDGYPDIFISGAGEQRLFRNTRKGKFEDVTAQAGLDKVDTVCFGAVFLDLDQDGDLDLVLAQYTTRAGIETALLDNKSAPPAGLAVYLNVGTAPPVAPPVNQPPLTVSFRKADGPSALLGQPGNVANVVATDLDHDRDLDLVLLADRAEPVTVLNDRLLTFHRAAFPKSLVPEGTWNGALALDANHDRLFDLFLVGPGQQPVLLLARGDAHAPDLAKWFEPGATDSPPLLHARTVDIDLDGYPDVVGFSEKRRPVLLHNDGRRLVNLPNAFGLDIRWPRDLVAVAAADLTSDDFPDLLVWSEGEGLHLYSSLGNGNHTLRIELDGQRRADGNNKLRTNADGIGTRVTAQVDDQWAIIQNATLETGLAQSRLPLLIGLGKKERADLVRMRWPDNTLQAEFNLAAGNVSRIAQTNRREGSCPILFAWDGRRFGFVTDFLGAGSMGERQADGSTRPPRPEESVKIEPEQLQPLDGRYVLKIAEPMSEITYLDRLQLVVLDHPADVRVYPDERFATATPAPTQDLLAFRQDIFPLSARDHRGRDVTRTLRHRDRNMVDDFAKRTWLGFAEEHSVELDFGDRLSQFGPNDRLVLCLAGWTDYAYPESLWAAAQAGVAPLAPVLERRQSDGTWKQVAEIGFPAGLPRMMTHEVTGLLGGPHCVLRLRTNLEVYWDQIFVAPLADTAGAVRVTRQEVDRATLSARGCMQEFSPDGRLPTVYDYDRLEAVPAIRPAGRVTTFGDVTELLHAADDRFVIFGPGDELTVSFEAAKLPALPAGWKRSFVLRTWGYCKDCGPFTATGETVEPLPFRGMSGYPYGAGEKYLNDAVHKEYLRRYQTRR